MGRKNAARPLAAIQYDWAVVKAQIDITDLLKLHPDALGAAQDIIRFLSEDLRLRGVSLATHQDSAVAGRIGFLAGPEHSFRDATLPPPE